MCLNFADLKTMSEKNYKKKLFFPFNFVTKEIIPHYTQQRLISANTVDFDEK